MIIVALIVLGLCLGSFVNALVWRVHEQESGKKNKKLSVLNGRSMCPHCKHELAAIDLIPLLSWLSLSGKCRYCHKPISYQYPMVEASVAALFVLSYIYWPADLKTSSEIAIFVLWLPILTGLVALTVYDLKWMLLPTRIIRPVFGLAVIQAAIIIANADDPAKTLVNYVLATIIGGGIFYLLFQLSAGKWIGGGDVRLGWLLGLLVGTPARSLLLIFLASLLGTFVALPMMASKKLDGKSIIPFGPFLIASAIIVQLFGADILHWYQHLFLPFSV